MARSRKFLAAGAAGVAAVALIAASTSVTGAYFSDSHNGSINASTGGVKIDVSDLTLHFDNLLPGNFKRQDVSFKATGTGPQDIWMVLPTDPTSTTAYLNGKVGTGGEKPALGRYGHFAVASPAGSFSSFNLTTAPAPGGTDSCTVNANGHSTGTPSYEATSKADFPPYCPVPNAILLSSNLGAGVTQTATITFGYTRLTKADAAQNSASSVVAPFRIVATQPGILPTDVNNVVRTTP